MGAREEQSPVASRQSPAKSLVVASLQFADFRACYHRAVAISDTTPEAKAIQERIWRNMTGEQRLLLAWDMSLFTRELARAGIRQEHPDWTETQVAHELLRLAFLPQPMPPGLSRAILRHGDASD